MSSTSVVDIFHWNYGVEVAVSKLGEGLALFARPVRNSSKNVYYHMINLFSSGIYGLTCVLKAGRAAIFIRQVVDSSKMSPATECVITTPQKLCFFTPRLFHSTRYYLV